MRERQNRNQKNWGERIEKFLREADSLPCKNGLPRLKEKYIKEAREYYHMAPAEKILYTFQANPTDSLHIHPWQRFYFTEKGFYGKQLSFVGGILFLSWEEFADMEISEAPLIKRFSGMVLRFGDIPVSCMWMAWPSAKRKREWLDFYRSLQRYLKMQTDEEEVKFGTDLRPDSQGHLALPQNRDSIGDREFEGRTDLVSIAVPGTVKCIGERAFANCENLKEICLQEGIETLESHVFTGCKSLSRVTLPASLKEIDGWAFYQSGLTEPVYSSAGDILVYCPAAAAGEKYQVRQGVKEIGGYAFAFQRNLRDVAFPQSLKIIRNRGFMECGISRAVLPHTIETVETGAFFRCGNLKEIVWNRQKDFLETAVELHRVKGEEILRPKSFAAPEDPYWKKEMFQGLARRCAAGEAQAMDEMADFFCAQALEVAKDGFYKSAELFWRLRAYRYGSRSAGESLKEWMKDHPGEALDSPYLSENLEGRGMGRGLNALGFLFFEEEREYTIQGMDGHGIALAKSYESEDGPDEDGFGREIYYDWWYLDESLTPIPGVPFIHSYSNIDRRAEYGQKKFSEIYRMAVKKRPFGSKRLFGAGEPSDK